MDIPYKALKTYRAVTDEVTVAPGLDIHGSDSSHLCCIAELPGIIKEEFPLKTLGRGICKGKMKAWPMGGVTKCLGAKSVTSEKWEVRHPHRSK